MSINVTSPVTGAAMSNFTTPGYNLTTDLAPPNGKSALVTSLTGTQTGARAHTVSSPFSNAIFKPANLRALPPANKLTGIISNIPNNTYKVITRVGLIPAANQPAIPVGFKTELPIPAGADSYDWPQIKAALSLHIGILTQISSQLGDTCATGSV